MAVERFLIHRHEPFEVVFLILLIVSGAAQLFTGATPGSLDALLPFWIRIVWVVSMVAGALIALFGITWRDVITGLYAENFGLLVGQLSLALYAGAGLVEIRASNSPVAVPLSIATIVAFHFRRKELKRVIRKLPKT